jgi:hypothetical protein
VLSAAVMDCPAAISNKRKSNEEEDVKVQKVRKDVVKEESGEGEKKEEEENSTADPRYTPLPLAPRYTPLATWLASIHPDLNQYVQGMLDFGYDDTFFIHGAAWHELKDAFKRCNMTRVHMRLVRDARTLLRDNWTY